MAISRLEVRPIEGGSGVTAGMLRSIPVGAILAAHYADLAAVAAAPCAPPPINETRPRRSGRAPLTQELLRDVAVAYIEENAPGKPVGAMKRIATRFGKPEETIRNWVTRARRDGWLGPSVKGRAGAAPGPLLRGGE